MDPEQRSALTASARHVLAETWGDARSSATADRLDKIWAGAVAQGWPAMLKEGALDGVLAVVAELGRVASPLPLMDASIAMSLLDEASVGAITSGAIRPVIVVDEDADVVRNVDGVQGATHVLALQSREGLATLREIKDVRFVDGLATPSWAHVSLGAQLSSHQVDRAAIAGAASLLRLGFAVRAMAAAGRAHDAAMEFAGAREQFGHPIGAFQAVQHRMADAATDVSIARGLVRAAVRLHDLDAETFQLAVELAVEHARRSAPAVQFAAHHTLAASGYFEEHEAPWLFRRVHADLLQLQRVPSPIGTIAGALLGGSTLPRFQLGPDAEAFRAELDAFLDAHPVGESGGLMEVDPGLSAAAAEAGLFGIGWPTDHGGRDASLQEQVVLNEELGYRRAPLTAPLAAADIIGNALVRHGTADQQARFLPRIRRGEFTFYLGYSEPEVGSDLASLRTTARRDGDEWVINGTKMWGTMADRAEHVWLAARTNPDAPKHEGITVFCFETGLPGWSRIEHRALSGEVSCTTVFDDVRVTDAARIGPIDGGWAVIVDALLSERQVMASHVARTHRRFDELVELLRNEPRLAGVEGSAVRSELSRLATRVQGARVLVHDSIVPPEGATGVEASMAKIVSSELAEDLGVSALDIFGPDAALADDLDGAIFSGGFADDLRLSIMHVVGGGTNDIQRNLVARALGLGL